MNYRSMIAALAAGVMLAGCGQGGAAGFSVAEPTSMPFTSVTGAAVKKSSKEILYVANSIRNNIATYVVGKAKPRLTIEAGLFHPLSMATDASGNLYVGNSGRTGVFEYKARTAEPFLTLKKNVNRAASVVLGSTGTLYIASAANNTVLICAPGKKRPSQILTQGLATPASLALDSAGDIYVSNDPNPEQNGSIVVFSSDGKTVLRTLTEGVSGYTLLAVDHNDNLYALSSWSSTLTEYAASSSEVLRTIKTESSPDAIAIDSENNVYVGSGEVAVYGTEGTTPVRTFGQGSDAYSLAIDKNDTVFVGGVEGGPHVAIYPAGSDEPSQTITDGIEAPGALSIGY